MYSAEPTPDPDAIAWDTAQVAAYLGVAVGTVSSYRGRKEMPAPDQTTGKRGHLWRPDRIIEWHATRPRRGSQARGPDRADAARPPDEITGRWLIHGERDIYDNEWVKLSLVDVELPDGDRFEHHVVTMRAAAIVVILNETRDRVLMMWRHRFASNIWNWELPGGLVDDGEDPARTALREAEEETGYRPKSIKRLLTFEPVIGMVRSPHHIYLAETAIRVGEPTETTEMQKMEWVRLSTVRQLIDSGQIQNAGSLVGLLYVVSQRT